MEDSKKTILIVEDEPALLKVYADRFSNEGFLVLKASNGQEGLDMALQKRPDIILLDILMPIMNGLTMMQKLQENESWDKTIPFIFLTNLSEHENQVMKSTVEERPAHYLIKSDWSLDSIVQKAKVAVLSHHEKEAIKSGLLRFMKKDHKKR